MEPSLPLATESFSYSWLSNCKPSIQSSYGGTPEEFNFSTMNSDSFCAESQNFNFDVSSIPQSPAVLAHADELFSDGLIRPVFAAPFKGESCNTPDATETIPSSSFSSRVVYATAGRIHRVFFTKWRKSTRQTLRDLFRHLNQIIHKFGCSRKSTRVGDIDKAEWQNKTRSSSQKASPNPVEVLSKGDLYCDHENSIYEAVLHCKRSIEK